MVHCNPVDDKGFDLGGAHLAGVAFVEEDEAPDPMEVGFLRARGVVLAADGFADDVEQFARRVVHYGLLPS